MIRKLPPVLLLSLLALSSTAYGQDKKANQKISVTKGKIDVDVKDMSFRDFCDQLGQALKLNLLVDPNVNEKISLKLGRLDQDRAFQIFASLIDGRVKKVAPKIFLFTQAPKNSLHLKKTTVHKALIRLTRSNKINLFIGPNVKDQPVALIKAKNFYPEDLMTTIAHQSGAVIVQKDEKFLRIVANDPLQILSAKNKLNHQFMPAPPKPLAANKDKKVNVDVTDVELSKVMDQISRATGIKIVVHPKVKEKVSVNLIKISPLEAVRVIAAITRCRLEVREGQYYLEPQYALSLSDHKIEISALLKKISKKLGRKIEFPKELKGKVTVQFSRLAAVDALKFIVHSLSDYKVVNELGKPIKIVLNAKNR